MDEETGLVRESSDLNLNSRKDMDYSINFIFIKSL